jgi:hypothetical protein
VGHVHIAVLRGDGLRPLLHGGTLDLDGLAADAADQMVMVVTRRAAPVDGLTLGRAQDVDLAGVGEGLERAVDGGQPYRVAPVLEHVVQVLGAAELVDLVERRSDRRPLPG